MNLVIIIGSALSGNKGAAAMLEAAIQGLTQRLPDVKFVLLSMYPEEDRKLNGYANLEIADASPLRLGIAINLLALLHFLLPSMRRLIESKSAVIRALSNARIMLDQGGITFADGREKFLLYNVASILPALWLQVPVVKCAQAIGPFENPVNRLVSKTILPRLKLIVTRGRITQEFADSLGLRNSLAGADMAFTLRHSTSPERVPHLDKGGGLIAVSPSVVMEKKIDDAGGDYVAEMAEFVSYLAAKGFQPIILPHSARQGSGKTHNNDLPLCLKIYAALPAAARKLSKLFDQELSASVLREMIGACDILVTSRFHAMVSGLATATPTLVVGWSHKYQEVLEMFEAGECALSHQEFTQAALRERFELMWGIRHTLSDRLAAHLPAVEKCAGEQLEKIIEIIEQRKLTNGL